VRVLVTGGTGFVGAHTVSALLADGHGVRVLARSPDRVAPAIEPLGVPVAAVEVVIGDVLDRAAVERALDGTDAVIHAANVYSLNAAHAERMGEVNTTGTRIVLTAAAERALDPIVHVSSFVALVPAEAFSEDSPPAHPRAPYCASKAEAERIALELRSAGAAVVLTNPGAAYGPHDPHLGENARFVRALLTNQLPVTAPGGWGIVDVRDLAVAHARILRLTSHPHRYLMLGYWRSLAEVRAVLQQVTGRRLPAVRVGERTFRAVARVADAAERRFGRDVGLSLDTIEVTSGPVWEGDGGSDALGLAWRSPEESLRDTVAWLHATGRLSARQAGRAGRQLGVESSQK
jgi:dihydroflavonol-4-reductase